MANNIMGPQGWIEKVRKETTSSYVWMLMQQYAEYYHAEKMKREWISVKDRMPELKQQILVICEKSKKVFSTERDDVFECFTLRTDILGEVTHWQPLPEHPDAKH